MLFERIIIRFPTAERLLTGKTSAQIIVYVALWRVEESS
jgi:hypothetical protein